GPTELASDPATNDVYIAAYNEHRIYRVTAAGAISVVAGTGTAGFNGDQSDATLAQLNTPYFVSIAGSNLYIGDQTNHRIRRMVINVTPRPIDTVAGSNSAGYTGDGDLAVVARLNNPLQAVVDAGGNLIIVDRSNNRIRK